MAGFMTDVFPFDPLARGLSRLCCRGPIVRKGCTPREFAPRNASPSLEQFSSEYGFSAPTGLRHRSPALPKATLGIISFTNPEGVAIYNPFRVVLDCSVVTQRSRETRQRWAMAAMPRWGIQKWDKLNP